MGLPSEQDWPENVTLPYNSFKTKAPQPINHLIPEIDPDSRDLMEVSLYWCDEGLGAVRIPFTPSVFHNSTSSLRTEKF